MMEVKLSTVNLATSVRVFKSLNLTPNLGVAPALFDTSKIPQNTLQA